MFRSIINKVIGYVTTRNMKTLANVTKFDGGVIRILGQNPGPMTLKGTNSYLVGKGNRRLLIDTTDPDKPEYIKLLTTVLDEEGTEIFKIVATHWHGDHVGSIKDVPVAENSEFWKFPRSDAEEDYGEVKFQELKDAQEFDIDGMTLKVLHTPGHTTDHVILFEESTRTVFSGDCILGEGTAVFEDLYDYMKSLQLILDLKPSVIYPGHGDVINDPIEKIEFYINHRNERERQILEAVTASDKPLTDMDIVKAVYTTTPRYLYPAAKINVDQHLGKLKKEGKIVEIDKNGETFWQTPANKL